jgi:hypothetical protein
LRCRSVYPGFDLRNLGGETLKLAGTGQILRSAGTHLLGSLFGASRISADLIFSFGGLAGAFGSGLSALQILQRSPQNLAGRTPHAIAGRADLRSGLQYIGTRATSVTVFVKLIGYHSLCTGNTIVYRSRRQAISGCR